MPTLGEHIREQRLTNGLSLGQLASKLGLTAAVVRSWERDQAVPNHGQFTTLAEELDDDLEALVALAPPAAPTVDIEPIVEPDALAEPEPIPEPEPVADPEPELEVAAPVAPDPVADEPEPAPIAASSGDAEISVVVDDADAAPDDAPADVVEDDGATSTGEATDPGAAADAATSDASTESDEAEQGGDDATSASGAGVAGGLETEQVSMDAVMAASSATTTDAAEEPADEPTGRRSFIEYWRDPEQRLRYYLRWVATAAVMLVLALVLVWAMGELLDAIGQVTDQFGTQEVDEFESLRG